MQLLIGGIIFCLVWFLILVVRAVIMTLRPSDIEYIETKNEGGGFLILRKRHSKYGAYFSIEEAHKYYVNKEPVKIHYGSATVGGVTTGGFYTTGGQQSINKGLPVADKYILRYKGKVVNHIQFNDFQRGDEPLLIKAKQDKIISKYVSDRGAIVVIPAAEKISVSNEKKASFLQTGNYQHLIDEVISNYPSKEKCQDIVDWICQDD